jgi:hypothetical protein
MLLKRPRLRCGGGLVDDLRLGRSFANTPRARNSPEIDRESKSRRCCEASWRRTVNKEMQQKWTTTTYALLVLLACDDPRASWILS